jgi:uncharacterized protein
LLHAKGLAIGGIIILETDETSVAEAIAADDPYAVGGLLESVKVVRWRKSFLAGVSYPDPIS